MSTVRSVSRQVVGINGSSIPRNTLNQKLVVRLWTVKKLFEGKKVFIFWDLQKHFSNELIGEDAQTEVVKGWLKKAKSTGITKPAVKPSKAVSSELSEIARLYWNLTTTTGQKRRLPPQAPTPPKKRVPKILDFRSLWLELWAKLTFEVGTRSYAPA